MFGREARVPCSLYKPSPEGSSYPEYVLEMRANFKKLHNTASENLRLSKEKRKIIYYRGTVQWQPMWGEKVLVQVIPTGVGQKLQSTWRGPYTVQEVPSEQTVLIRNGRKLEKIHVNRLKRYYDRG